MDDREEAVEVRLLDLQVKRQRHGIADRNIFASAYVGLDGEEVRRRLVVDEQGCVARRGSERRSDWEGSERAMGSCEARSDLVGDLRCSRSSAGRQA
jgi:hypothetical protein